MTIKTIVISGGTKGLWKSIVYGFLKEGHNVATFSSNEDNYKSLNTELWKDFEDEKFLVCKCDIKNESEMIHFQKTVLEKFGNVEVLINNAWKGYYEYCENGCMDKFQEIIHINMIGVAYLTQIVLPIMKQNGRGQIINISSISGFWSQEKNAFYSATKHWLIWYTKGLREEVKKNNIKVATICPWMIDTEFFTIQELKEMEQRFWVSKLKMLHTNDVVVLVKTIVYQSITSDIQDIIIKPF